MYPLDDFNHSVIDFGNGIYMDVVDFEERFGTSKEHKFEYNHFIEHEKVTPAWKVIFDEWKQKGILN